jgi:hypothetical protein
MYKIVKYTEKNSQCTYGNWQLQGRRMARAKKTPRPKRLQGNGFYKGHMTHIIASIPLKMYLKSLASLEKASLSLKKWSK